MGSAGRGRRGGSRATPATRPRKWQRRGIPIGALGLALRGELALGRGQLTPALSTATVCILRPLFRQRVWRRVVCFGLEMGEDSPHSFVQSRVDSRAGSFFYIRNCSSEFGCHLPPIFVGCCCPFRCAIPSRCIFVTGSSVEPRFAAISAMTRTPWFNSFAPPSFPQTFETKSI